MFTYLFIHFFMLVPIFFLIELAICDPNVNGFQLLSSHGWFHLRIGGASGENTIIS
jgi:hypothetical protein